MASCVRNIHTKNYQNPVIGFQVTVEKVGDVFFGTQCSSLLHVWHEKCVHLPSSFLHELQNMNVCEIVQVLAFLGHHQELLILVLIKNDHSTIQLTAYSCNTGDLVLFFQQNSSEVTCFHILTHKGHDHWRSQEVDVG